MEQEFVNVMLTVSAYAVFVVILSSVILITKKVEDQKWRERVIQVQRYATYVALASLIPYGGTQMEAFMPIFEEKYSSSPAFRVLCMMTICWTMLNLHRKIIEPDRNMPIEKTSSMISMGMTMIVLIKLYDGFLSLF